MAHRRQQERNDRRAAMAAWMLVNVNRDSDKKPEPFTLEEVTTWLGYAGQYVQRPPQPPVPAVPPTVEDLKQRIDLVHLLHRGLYGDNGPVDAGGE